MILAEPRRDDSASLTKILKHLMVGVFLLTAIDTLWRRADEFHEKRGVKDSDSHKEP